MQISISSNIKDVERKLTAIQRKQIPFAASQAINSVAFTAQKELQRQTDAKIDKPTPFTKRAFKVKKATKRESHGLIYVDDAHDYLNWIIHGGTRRAQGKGTGVPTRNKKLNQYGNIPGRRTGLVKGSNQFLGTVGSITGVWQRTGGKKGRSVKLMVALERQVTYKKQFPFYKIVQGIVKARFDIEFAAHLSRALATAR